MVNPLREFNITIKDRPGKENLVADFLSHVPRTDNAVAVEDQFPDEHMFALTVKTRGYSPYPLVFGKEPIFPIEFEIQTLRIAQEVGLDLNEAQINRLQQINELDEIWLSAFQHTALIQQQREKWHDTLIKKKIFHEGDWELLYDSRFQDFLAKLQTRWLGPYKIKEVHDNGTLTLSTIDGYGYSFKANGHRVRLYHKLLTRESFCQQIHEDSTIQILAAKGNSSTAPVP
eukprot:PITA_28997